MTVYDGSEDVWQEDYRRERRLGRVAQALARAVNVSYDGRVDEAQQRLDDAKESWHGGGRIREHMDDADVLDITKADEAREFRRHCREAGQLLAVYADFAVRFDSGGEVA